MAAISHNKQLKLPYANRPTLGWHILVPYHTKCPSGLRGRGLRVNAKEAALRMSTDPRQTVLSPRRERAPGARSGARRAGAPPPGSLLTVWEEPGKLCSLETISQADTFLKLTVRLLEPRLWALSRGAIGKAQTGPPSRAAQVPTCCCGQGRELLAVTSYFRPHPVETVNGKIRSSYGAVSRQAQI